MIVCMIFSLFSMNHSSYIFLNCTWYFVIAILWCWSHPKTMAITLDHGQMQCKSRHDKESFVNIAMDHQWSGKECFVNPY